MLYASSELVSKLVHWYFHTIDHRPYGNRKNERGVGCLCILCIRELPRCVLLQLFYYWSYRAGRLWVFCQRLEQ